MTDIQKADPKARRTSLVIVGGGALLGVALIRLAGTLRPEFEAWVRQDMSFRPWMVMAVVTLLTAGPVLGLAGFLWRLGRRIVRAERYPPPGLAVLHDTPVVIGHAAARRGRLVQAFAAVLALAGPLLAFFVWRLAYLLRGGAA